MYQPKQNYYSRTPATAYPKRPLHSFQDLEVYQKALECSVLVAKQMDKWLATAKVDEPLPKSRSVEAKSPRGQKRTSAAPLNEAAISAVGHGSGIIDELLLKNMLPCALGIPHQVAEAHSLRFGDHTAGIAAIEKAMLGCNKMVVYLEQFRDICDSGIPWEFFDDVIKKYIYVRRKMLRLEQAWKKFMPGYKKEE